MVISPTNPYVYMYIKFDMSDTEKWSLVHQATIDKTKPWSVAETVFHYNIFQVNISVRIYNGVALGVSINFEKIK